MRTAAVAILALLSALAAVAAPPQCTPARGAFVVLHKPPAAADLARVKADGLNTVVLQYAIGERETLPDEIENVKTFIARADAAGLCYLLGLAYAGNWDHEDIHAHVVRNLDLLPELRKLKTAGFAGWYMPLEVGNGGSDYGRIANEFAAFRSVPEPVAMSVYFNPAASDAATFGTIVAQVTSPFDIVIVQDSVGERAITDFARDLHPYYRAAAANTHAELWADVEAFACRRVDAQRVCDGWRKVAKPSRIRAQVAAAKEHTPNIVAYDADVRAHIDWSRLSADHLDAGVIDANGTRETRAELRIRAHDLTVTLAGQTEEHAVDTFPLHVYNFDLMSLNVTLPRVVTGTRDFHFYVAEPTFGAKPGVMELRGEVRAEYRGVETLRGVRTRKYRLTGPGMAGREGTLWINDADGYMERFESPLANNPGWNSLRLDRRGVSRMTASEWEAYKKRNVGVGVR